MGTFDTEIQAAKAFDFYWIAINGGKASTNFTYTPQEVKQMIEDFFTNDRTFTC